MKQLTLGVMKIWAVRLGIAAPPLRWSGALGQAATPLAHQGATPRMVKGQIIVGAVVLLVFIASSPAVRAPSFAGSVLLADGRSKAMLHLEDGPLAWSRLGSRVTCNASRSSSRARPRYRSVAH